MSATTDAALPAAAFDYFLAVSTAVRQAGDHCASSDYDAAAAALDITAADAQLRRAVPNIADALTDHAHQFLDGCLERIDPPAKRSERLGTAITHAGRYVASRASASLLEALTDLLVDDKLHSAVTAAETAVEQAQAKYDAGLQALEAAVRNENLAAIAKQRPDVEVTLPSQLDKARLNLTAAQAGVAEAKAQNGALLTELAAARAEQAQAATFEAYRAWEAAVQAARDTTSTRTAVDQVVAGAQTAGAQLRGEHDRLAASADEAKAARFRRLAGLPVVVAS